MASDEFESAPFDRPLPARSRQTPPVPPGTGTFGMWLFLAALFMLFASAVVGYVVVRLQAENPNPAMHRLPIAAGTLHYPPILWLSTVLVVGVSVCMSRALSRLRMERQGAFRKWIGGATALAVGFLAVQSPAMVRLLADDRRFHQSGVFLYALVFVLVLLHALHVVGGMVALVRVAVRGRRGVYDHEHYQPVRHATMYWHFLDAVWLVMFATFLLTA